MSESGHNGPKVFTDVVEARKYAEEAAALVTVVTLAEVGDIW